MSNKGEFFEVYPVTPIFGLLLYLKAYSQKQVITRLCYIFGLTAVRPPPRPI